jgi:signal transduction histidine kinase
MQQMITDILSYSSIEGEEKEIINLQAVLDETLELLDQTIKEKGATITSDSLPAAFADAAQIRQLFQNLISNALKFAKPDVPPRITFSHTIKKGKEITIPGASTNLKYLQICIADNGIGFEEEYAEKIFGLFNRLHSKSAYEGSGLGLSIARRIVENHNGFIAAQSKKGEGATFIITLPTSGHQ